MIFSTYYGYKIDVDVLGKTIAFERDEEQNFRAVIKYDDINSSDKIDQQLPEEIAKQLAGLFRG